MCSAGWSEDGINDIIIIASIYAMMNRLLEGSGLKENVEPLGFTPERVRVGHYADMLALLC